MRRLRIYGILCVAAGILAGCRHTQRLLIQPGTLVLQTPDSIAAGRLLTVKVQTRHFYPGEKVYIQYQGSWGTWMEEFVVGKDNAVNFKDSLTGMHTLRALYNSKLLAEKQVKVFPVAPASPMDTYLGSKSVVANGKDWAMITAIPTDSFGNLIPEYTPVDFAMLRPDKRMEHYTAPTHAGVAYQKITAGTTIGKTFVGVDVQGVESKEKELQEVAGFPMPFTIAAESKSIYADSRQMFRVITSTLKDSFNNLVQDGTAVFFYCRDANGTFRQLSAYTLRGVAALYMQNPTSAGDMIIEASTFGGGKSNVLSIYFTSAFQDIPVHFDSLGKSLWVGFLKGKLNQLVPNGTAVTLRIDSTVNMQQETVGGIARFDLQDLAKGKHSARVTVFDTCIQKELNIR